MRPRALAVVALSVVVAAVCGRLGVWQLDRLHAKQRLHGSQRAALEAPPRDLAAPLPLAPLVGSRVRVHGVWDRSAHVLLSGRTHQGAAGVSWVSVLRLPTGEGVLVERGWVPADDARDATLDSTAFADTVVTGLALPIVAPARRTMWVRLPERSVGEVRWSARALVVDSVAALVPKAELEGEMGDNFVGLHARLMSQALRKITGNVSRINTCMVFLNQIREKIGVMFGSPETTTGGRALKFFSSIRLEVRRTGALKDGETVIGNRTKIKVVKNKLAPPFREAEVDILYGEGISREGDLLDLGVTHGVVEKSGSWFSFQGERLGQGRENARLFLREHAEVRRSIDATIRSKTGLTAAKPPASQAPPLLRAAAQGAA